jgi:hypothetical protein
MIPTRPLALAALLLAAACAPLPEPTPVALMSTAEAAAVARCDAQAIAAAAPIRNLWDREVFGRTVHARCLDAWNLERRAAAEEAARTTLPSPERRAWAERQCVGARDVPACLAFLAQPPVR